MTLTEDTLFESRCCFRLCIGATEKIKQHLTDYPDDPKGSLEFWDVIVENLRIATMIATRMQAELKEGWPRD